MCARGRESLERQPGGAPFNSVAPTYRLPTAPKHVLERDARCLRNHRLSSNTSHCQGHRHRHHGRWRCRAFARRCIRPSDVAARRPHAQHGRPRGHHLIASIWGRRRAGMVYNAVKEKRSACQAMGSMAKKTSASTASRPARFFSEGRGQAPQAVRGIPQITGGAFRSAASPAKKARRLSRSSPQRASWNSGSCVR